MVLPSSVGRRSHIGATACSVSVMDPSVRDRKNLSVMLRSHAAGRSRKGELAANTSAMAQRLGVRLRGAVTRALGAGYN